MTSYRRLAFILAFVVHIPNNESLLFCFRLCLYQKRKGWPQIEQYEDEAH